MRIAFIAHDKKKDDIVDFVKRYKNVFKNHEIFATGTTGKLISDATGIKIHRFLSGPMGGDQQIGARVAQGDMDIVIFLRDPLTAQPHEPDISALLRICDVHCVPLATNLGTAEIFVKALRNYSEG
ncbi:methylglyoxal synthase [Clostridium luticellarii]|jgi:methylglyoxal synthase|uniref:Methylglyoxal synthase n=1 Tax=Clostridium luticellarii TaxID=1691940 RepID=A0A2T0BPG2_9CLOT|nr:methylglyoxal synthase [Clostridium luticellarii]MCI1945800.1 methylglyoxal synthase [Clostridium luticellarii]MCI1967604.1 methylglyoxal synthase [Clostridium luticellarii]MCI1996491.1 methylglyoxal synthase [Clostridium luticellarii]MCI2041286.1 methylglyoxal synthase [Clostridium luticellarii]PRR85760.1 Methylglyoxal synthase [Clostridium luticellarii]